MKFSKNSGYSEKFQFSEDDFVRTDSYFINSKNLKFSKNSGYSEKLKFSEDYFVRTDSYFINNLMRIQNSSNNNLENDRGNAENKSDTDSSKDDLKNDQNNDNDNFEIENIIEYQKIFKNVSIGQLIGNSYFVEMKRVEITRRKKTYKVTSKEVYSTGYKDLTGVFILFKNKDKFQPVYSNKYEYIYELYRFFNNDI